jgi:hypothetical protein
MNGNLPSGEDFNFNSNGYPCALGVNDFNLMSGGEDFEYRLVKMKSKATEPSNRISDWEFVAKLQLNGREGENPVDLMAEFLPIANEKLKAATGGEVPELPVGFLDQTKHVCRYLIDFNLQTGEIFIK